MSKSKLDISVSEHTGLLAIGFRDSDSDYVELAKEDIALLLEELPKYKDKVASNEEFK